MSEFRRDPVIGRWVIIDPSRTFEKIKPSSSYPKDISNCPFCAGNERLTRPAILTYYGLGAKSKDWILRVIPNNKPILEIEGSLKRRADGMYDKMDGIGAHEIIIETPDHNAKPYSFTPQNRELVVHAAIERIKDLRNDLRFEYILYFKNYGIESNAVFEHPYSQLIAMPIVPRRVKEEIDGGKKYFEYKERCIFCDIAENEIANGQRLVLENDFFVAFCPYASRYPFEICLLPKKHCSDFDSITPAEITAYSQAMSALYKKLNKALDDSAFSVLVYTAPLKEKNLPYYHWHVEIMPKLIKSSGFEWGTGLYANHVYPEEAAKYLRECQ
jgi:UDPglucose--hexose-1-phosphate uridylyltransferase